MGRAYSTNGAWRNACRILVGKSEGKRPLGRPKLRWVNNIKMNLREMGWGGVAVPLLFGQPQVEAPSVAISPFVIL
jgi:hypothetical protein